MWLHWTFFVMSYMSRMVIENRIFCGDHRLRRILVIGRHIFRCEKLVHYDLRVLYPLAEANTVHSYVVSASGCILAQYGEYLTPC
jgi:hypothetical protein